MKIINLLFLLWCLTSYTTVLKLYKETEHFQVFCLPIDNPVADKILQKQDGLFQQLSHDFKHYYDGKIIISIYPDLESFHKTISWPDATDWVIGKTTSTERIIVSPRNPGPAHSYDSVMKAQANGLVHFLLPININGINYHVGLFRELVYIKHIFF